MIYRCLVHIYIYIYIGKGSLDNVYLDNFDNRFSNKYEKLLKIEKSYNMFFYL
jgi:hypothetical protein